jgi:hypothetical protein
MMLHLRTHGLCQSCLRLVPVTDGVSGISRSSSRWRTMACPGCGGQTCSCDACAATAQAMAAGDWRCLSADEQARALSWTPGGGLVLRPQHRGSPCPS